jgi:hypothetical protein
MPLIIHFLVKNTIYANGAIVALFVENNVMPYLQTKEPGFDDIISLLKENWQMIQTLDGSIYLPIIDDCLFFRPGLGGIVPNAIQIGDGFSG